MMRLLHIHIIVEWDIFRGPKDQVLLELWRYSTTVLAIIELSNAVCFEFPNFGETKASKFSSIRMHISDSAFWSSKRYSFLRVGTYLISSLLLFATLCKSMSSSLLFSVTILNMLDGFLLCMMIKANPFALKQ